jgi:N-acetylneuraminic acid mutarotase
LFHRRAFLRTGALAALGVAAAACSSGKPDANPTGSSSPSSSPTGTAGPQRGASWRRLNKTGPSARSHHTLTANAEGSIVFLFGGKQGSRVLRDAWAYERSTGLWSPLPTGGPPARFGHSAAFVDGHWVLFGGQNGGAFYNDVWAFDSVHGTWLQIKRGDARPAARYGASGTTIANSLTISHGINRQGRLDDTWALSTKWTNVTPRSGPRPAKRCLHRAEYLTGLTRMALFGGQGNTAAYLGDTWLYDPRTLEWKQVTGPGPSPRNLYASCATANHMYVFGGAARGGPLRDLWSFDGTAWRQIKASGTPPRARSATEGASSAGAKMFMFGGHDGRRELADFWELTLPE